jgi:hypothetical protein
LERVIEEFGNLKDIYNMDESGSAIGEIKATKRIINADVARSFKRNLVVKSG